jgi:hypothetical protein
MHTGYDWDKVKLSSGVVGYVASKYLSPCNDTQNVTIDGENVKAVPNTTVKTMVNELGITSYEVTKDGTKLAETDKIGTGYVLKDNNNNKEYTLVVLGDTNGDGNVNSLDALDILKQSVGTVNKTGAYATAMDTNSDGKVNSSDSLLVLKSSVGLSNINI